MSTVASSIASHLRERFINRNRMDWHHLAVSLLAWASAAKLTAVALHLRGAAHHGDPAVRAGRAAFNQFFHSRHAVSCAEHMVSGFGMALVGFAVLQLLYFAMSARRNVASAPKPVSAGWRWTIMAFVATSAAALMTQIAYNGTAWVIAVLTVIAVLLCTTYHERLEQMAIAAPQRLTALGAGLLWLNYELVWKVTRWTTSPTGHGVVVAELAGSLLILLATSAGAGALIRRFRWLALREPMVSTASATSESWR